MQSILKTVSNSLDKVNIAPGLLPPNTAETETTNMPTEAAEVVNGNTRWTSNDFQMVAATLLQGNTTPLTNDTAGATAAPVAAGDDSSATEDNNVDVMATVHGTKCRMDDRATEPSINDIVPERDFAIKTTVGDTLTRNLGIMVCLILTFFANVSAK